MKYLTSKIAIVIYVLIVGSAIFFAYKAFKKQDASSPSPATQQLQKNDSSSSASSTDDLSNDNDQDDSNSATDNTQSTSNTSPGSTGDNSAPVSVEKKTSGSVLAHITPQHCSDNCQAFAIDLNLFEYCQQVCGISPVKNVTSCDGKSGIQKDYCNKDLAITKEDSSICDKISDANVKQTCQNRIAQDAIENQGNSGSDN